jgi:type IV pilus assembly protein PilE
MLLKKKSLGYSLVELMITVAIIFVLAGIAVPLYNGYVREGHFTTMRATMNGLRTIIEDYRLDNGNYGAAGNLVDLAAIDGRFGWEPGGDTSGYTYTVSVTATDSYDIWGVANGNSTIWVRCEDRFSTCCDPDTSSGGAPTDAC